MNNIQSGGGVIYDHCLFHLLGKFSSDTEKAVNIAIRNSEVYGDSSKVCININSVAGDPLLAVYNNIISDCKDGIEILSAAISIRNNTINNCTRYGVYAYDTVGEFDISYNSFANNGVYDILLDDIDNVAIVQNKFTPQTQHNTTVYAMDIEHIIVRENDFKALKHDYILLFERVDFIEIIGNNFVNNMNKYGVIYINTTVNVSVLRNNLIGNEGRYVLYMENGIDLYMIENNMSNNTVMDSMVFMKEFENVQIKFNKYNGNVNMFGEMICVQKTNYISVMNNVINHNYVGGGVISSDMNGNIYILYNEFNANFGGGVEFGQLILIKKTVNTNISYNIFKNAMDLQHILYFEYMDEVNMALIEHNNFMQSDNITAYILCNGVHTLDTKIFVNLNHFYDETYIKYFISTQDVFIDANDNYYNGLKTYESIMPKMNGICEFINVSRIIEDNDNNLNTCSWQFIDCNHSINTHCDSDTLTPTQVTQYPSISPSKTPTQLPSILVTHFIEIIPTNHKTNVETTQIFTSTSQILQLMRPKNGGEGTFMVIAGSSGITLVFLLFGMILLYVFFKLKKLKNETAHLNKQIRGADSNNNRYNNNDDDLDDLDAIMNAMNLNINMDNINYNARKASKLSVISAAAMSKKSTLFSSKKSSLNMNNNMVHVLDANSSTPRPTPRPPPRKSPHNYQVRKMDFEEEKNVIAQGHDHDQDTDRDNSSALYMNYSHNPIIEIEGNQTQLDSHSHAPYDGNMIMNAINTSMPNIGELSMTAKHSHSNLHIKNDSNFKLKIGFTNDEHINDENDSNLSHLISEEETSESSAFTIKSEHEEHKMSINVVEIVDKNNLHNDIHNGYIGLISPTETTTVATPPTPQKVQSPTSLDPDEILHSLHFRQKLIQQSQPGTPQAAHKLPKPKTKGHWM